MKYTFTNVPDILVGQYDPIPSGLHPGVSVYVPRLLRVDPNRRPSADQILTMKYIIKNLQILLQNSTYFSDHDDLGHPGLKVASRILPDSDGTSDYYTDGTLSSSYVWMYLLWLKIKLLRPPPLTPASNDNVNEM